VIGYRLLAGSLIALAVAGSCLADVPTLPVACSDSPTAECLVKAVIDAATPEDADILIRGVGILVDHDRKALAKQLLIDVDQVPAAAVYAGAQYRQVNDYLERGRLEEMADAWHRLGDDKKAEDDLERAIDLATRSVADNASTHPGPQPPGALASAYYEVASNEAEWGLTEQAKKTLADMRRASPALKAEDAAGWEVMAWRNGKRPDLALAAAELVPDHADSLIERYLISPYSSSADDAAEYAVAAERIRGACQSAQAYAHLASIAAHDRPGEARQILESGIAAFAKASDDRNVPFVFPADPLVTLARPWFSLNDPAQALKTLELRSRRPDLFPATTPLPIDDYMVRAEALVRTDRIDEALKVASEATANFPTRPVVVRPFMRDDVITEGPRTIIHRPDGGVNAGDAVYRTILDTLAGMGEPEEVRKVAARFPTRPNPMSVDTIVVRANLSAKRWNDAVATVRTLPAKDWPFLISQVAVSLAQGGEDEKAVETALLLPVTPRNYGQLGLIQVAKAQTDAGRKVAALDTLQHLDEVGATTASATEIASAQAAVGDFNGAWATLKHTDPRLPEKYEDAIIAEQAQAGDCHGALSQVMTTSSRTAWIGGLIAIASAC
jgi:tetratricopeptide (TPR) repeat protein